MSVIRRPPQLPRPGLAALLLAAALAPWVAWRAQPINDISLLLPPPPLVPPPLPVLEDSYSGELVLPVAAPAPPAALLGAPLAINPGRGSGSGAGGFKPEDLLIKPLGSINYKRRGEIDRNAQLVGESMRHPFPTAYLPLSKGNYYIVNSAYGGRDTSDPRYPRNSALYAGLGLGDPYSWVGIQAEVGVPSVNDLNYGNTLDLKVSRDIWNSPELRIGVGAGWLSAANSGYSSLNESSQYGVVTAAWRLNSPRLPYDRIMHLNVGFGARTLGDLDINNQQLFTSLGIETSPQVGFSAGFNANGLLFNSTLRF